MDPIKEAQETLEEFELQKFEEDPMKYYTFDDDWWTGE